MTSGLDQREEEAVEESREGSEARRKGLPLLAIPDVSWHWVRGWRSEDAWIHSGGVEGFKLRMAARKRLKKAGAPVGFADLFSGEAAE